ncbi:MAG: hydrogenase [Spirochaetes bacterium]|nr:MAG: hydrogenase [Spirochaetota bacterium]
MMKNIYQPYPAKIERIVDETFNIKTYTVKFINGDIAKSFNYKQGQFVEISIPGAGEAPFSITSTPSRPGNLEFTIRKIGRVTTKIFELKEGDLLHIRGPYGNSFPFEEVEGKNLYFIAGGIGLAPLRSVINQAFDHRPRFGEIKILYGAKSPAEFCYREEIPIWKKLPDTEVLLTVDNPDGEWQGNVGVVTTLMDKTKLSPLNSVVYVCGPPVMLKFVMLKLIEMGFKDGDIYVTLERYMQCGVGKCGHCNIGDKFVCVDGPVFSYRDIKVFPERERAV